MTSATGQRCGHGLTSSIPLLSVPGTMSVADRIRAKLVAELMPVRLTIRDESHRHAGHAGARPEGETHFHVEIVSAAFIGESRVARQRRVYRALADELAGPVHALALSTLTPDEEAAPSPSSSGR